MLMAVGFSKDKKTKDYPLVSVIIASYNSWPRIKNCLDSLLAQDTKYCFEIIVADSSDDNTQQSIRDNYPTVDLIVLGERTFPGPARNKAIAKAKGDIFACIDSDCTADKRWINRIVENHLIGMRVIGGAVLNGTPESYFGTAEYLMEFSEYMPFQNKKTLRMIPTCNLSFKRDVFEKVGGFECIKNGENLFKSEDVIFCHKIREKGFAINFCNKMQIKHINRKKLKKILSNQYDLGLSSAVSRSRVNIKGSFLLQYGVFCWFIPIVKISRIGFRAFGFGIRTFFDFIKHSPIIIMGCFYYSWGFCKGRKLSKNFRWK